MSKNNKYWFKRRRYGYGWFPVTKQGWLVVVVYVVSITIGSITILGTDEDPSQNRIIAFFAFFAASLVILLTITYMKGPKAKWRWGKSPDDNPDEDA